MGDNKKAVGIIGFGNMGSAIAERLKQNYNIVVFDKDKSKTCSLSGIYVAKDSIDLAENSETVILAVKPQDFDNLLDEIKEGSKDKLIISIAAGITTGYIEKKLTEARVVRAMPNLPAKVGEGITCLSRGKFATDEDLRFVEELFNNLGKTLRLNEKRMNEATAISGSGPAYYCDKIESNSEEHKKNPVKFQQNFITEFTEAAKAIGFDDRTAKVLAHITVVGTEILLKEAKLTPAELKKQITSKGGTTQAALEVLNNNGLLVDAIKAAVKRAKELSS